MYKLVAESKGSIDPWIQGLTDPTVTVSPWIQPLRCILQSNCKRASTPWLPCRNEMFFCRKVAPLFVLFPSPLAVYFVLDFTTAGCWLQSTPAFFSRTCELENCYRPKRCVKHCSVIIERITSKPALLFSSAQNLARNHPTAQGQTAHLITLL